MHVCSQASAIVLGGCQAMIDKFGWGVAVGIGMWSGFWYEGWMENALSDKLCF